MGGRSSPEMTLRVPPSTVAQAGVDPTIDGRAVQDTLRRAITTRSGDCSSGLHQARSTMMRAHPLAET